MMPDRSDGSINLSSVWCAIPVYNNAATILDVARQCREQLGHVIVIDDGSTDAHLPELLRPLDVTVLRHPTNRGKGQALLTAFAHAKQNGAAYLITLDGDGQHFPADIPRFFPHLSPATILIGARDEITGQMPKSSRFGREFSDFWIRLEAGGNARDTQSGFRAYPLAGVMQLPLRSHFYNFEMEIITKAMWAGMRTASVPIRVWYPPAQQRVSSFDPFRDNLRISLLHTRLVLRQLLPIPHRQIIDTRTGSSDISLKATFGFANIGRASGRLARDWLAEGRPIFGPFENGGVVFRPIFRDRPEGGAVVLPQKNTAFRAVAKQVMCENNSPIALAVCAAVSIIMSIVLWPLGMLAVAYVAIRLHLNKIVALACVVICLPPIVPRICEKVGRALVTFDAHPRLQWIAGAHAVAIPAAIFVGWFVYKLQSRDGTARPGSVGQSL